MPEIVDDISRNKLKIDLFFNPEDKEWVTYTIEILKREGNNWLISAELSLLDRQTQFLDIYYEKELLSLIKAIESIEQNKICQSYFTPIDERDFEIRLERLDNIEKVSFTYISNCGTRSSSVNFLVNYKELKKFRNEIEQEHQRIEEQLNGLIWIKNHSS